MGDFIEKHLSQLVQGGAQPVVTFRKSILDQESYLEPGMRGRIIGKRSDSDDSSNFVVELSEFDAFNRPFETNNYYDKNQVPCLTAREAGFYKPQEHVWIDLNVEIQAFDIENIDRLALYAKFAAEGAEKSYVQWLEDALLAASTPLAA